MIKILLLILSLNTSAEAELSAKHQKAIQSKCSKLYTKIKKSSKICACERLNFTWLLEDDSWQDFKSLYVNKEEKSKLIIIDELEAMDTLILEVRSGCQKKRTYIAPKARTNRALANQKK